MARAPKSSLTGTQVTLLRLQGCKNMKNVVIAETASHLLRNRISPGEAAGVETSLGFTGRLRTEDLIFVIAWLVTDGVPLMVQHLGHPWVRFPLRCCLLAPSCPSWVILKAWLLLSQPCHGWATSCTASGLCAPCHGWIHSLYLLGFSAQK